MQRVMAEVLTRDDSQRDIWGQHERMIQAVIAGDGEEAERLAREHILQSATFMIASLRAGRRPVTGHVRRAAKPNGRALERRLD
jgi:DNA-binding GntR family transcriptional regulator